MTTTMHAGERIAYIVLAVAVAVLTYNLFRAEQKRYQNLKPMAHAFEMQWRLNEIIHGQTTSANPRSEALKQQYDDFTKTSVRKFTHLLENLGDRLDPTATTIVQQMTSRLDRCSGEEAPRSDCERNHTTRAMADDAVALQGYLDAYARKLSKIPPNELELHISGLQGLAAAIILITAALAVYQRHKFRRLESEHLRSISTFHAHFIQSRVTGLGLFLETLGPSSAYSSSMLAEARATVRELDSAQQMLRKINYGHAGPNVAFGQIARSVSEKNPSVDFQVSEPARAVAVQEAQIRLMLEEFLSNALAATELVETPSIQVTAVLLRKGLRRRKGLSIEVADNGIGIDRAAIPKATQPFFTTKSGPYRGLGLTAASQMAQTLGGDFQISRRESGGTVVTVWLPIRAVAPRA